MNRTGPLEHMLAILTLLLTDRLAAQQYIRGLPPDEAYPLAALACMTVADHLRDIADERDLDVFVLLQRVALKAATVGT